MAITKGFGGNKPLFDHIQYYSLGVLTDMKQRYQHRAMQWYRKHHLAFMDGAKFTEEKPVRNVEEAFDFSKKKFNVFSK